VLAPKSKGPNVDAAFWGVPPQIDKTFLGKSHMIEMIDTTSEGIVKVIRTLEK
jgi:hypothetical protein